MFGSLALLAELVNNGGRSKISLGKNNPLEVDRTLLDINLIGAGSLRPKPFFRI